MRRPWRRYCMHLSLRLKMPLPHLLKTLSSAEIAEYMAFDMTSNPEWVKAYEQQQLATKVREETPEQTVARFKRITEGKRNR